MRRIASVLVFLSLTLLLFSNTEAQQTPNFYGRVLRYNPNGESIAYPNLKVLIVDRIRGTSLPKFTDMNGFFYFDRLRSCNDKYLLEIYKGDRRIYVKTIQVKSCPYAHPPIVLAE